MEEFKGTQGKWRYTDEYSNSTLYMPYWYMEGEHQKGIEGEYVCRIYNEDDARLIAVAPELLAILQKSVSFIEDAIKWYDSKGSVHQEFISEDKEFLHEVKETINKALGK